jgi:carbonic anhydrase/acetyltransferase-like protein (isoleucine patch superfamily)
MDKFRIPKRLDKPVIFPGAWVAPSAVLLGKITVRRGASIWYGCVLRSDFESAEIEVGEDSNVQDGAVLHVDWDLPCRLGARVTVGHGAILHGTTVEDDCLIGMGAILLSGSKIGRGSIVAAGALVPEGMAILAGSVVSGVPAKVRREVTDADRAKMENGWKVYAELRDLHKNGDTIFNSEFREKK